MHNYFECSIRYGKLDENGLPKKVTEPYLVDALSHAEAEERIIKEMQPFVNGEFSVTKVRRANIAELFESIDARDDKWYKCRVNFIVFDQEKGIEKKTPSNMYVQANEIEMALINLQAALKDTMYDYTITAISETMIMDVYKYEQMEAE